MANTKQTRFRNNDIISASEVGQYYFCSIAWYLQRCGYEPKSQFLEEGIKKHKELGIAIERVDSNIKKARMYKVLGLILMIFVFIIILTEVVL